MRRRRGSIFQPRYTRNGVTHVSPIWMIQYVHKVNRRVVRESSRSTDRKVAERLLTKRLAQADEGRRVTGGEHKIRVRDLFDSLLADYRSNHRPSIGRLEDALNHLAPHFAPMRAAQVTAADVIRYIEFRQSEGASNGTCNRELTALKRAYNLAVGHESIQRVPVIKLLREDNVRQGFFERPEFEALCKHLPDYIRPIVQMGYITGWRIPSEILPLTWGQVDFQGGWIRLEPGSTKNRQGRQFPMLPELRTILEAQWLQAPRDRRGRGDRVFLRDGKPIGSFRKAWATACRLAGIPGRIPHDLRRTCIRNMVRRGVVKRIAMKLSGHESRSVFERYNIVSEGDLHEAATKLSRSVRDSVRTLPPVVVSPDGPVAQADRAEVS